ncbi:RNA polymerase I enhancer binding protein [Coemansia sp. Benny D115]|nr:RNA polymerase I enhancer binding protein [Coemansia sp. Benny D115]
MLLPITSPLPKSKFTVKKRHRWTAEQDAKLQALVKEHGTKWGYIAGEIGIEGDFMKVRRRWEVLQPKGKSSWLKHEDTDLANAIDNLIKKGQNMNMLGFWTAVSEQLKTNRSPRQCHIRWVRTLLPMQGKIVTQTRFKNIRGWKWSDDEIKRILDAQAVMKNVSDSKEAVEKASQTEPWLLIKTDVQSTLKKGFWMCISRAVGTRTPSQCFTKWGYLYYQPEVASMTTEKARLLAQLVETHGRRWGYLVDNYFPDQHPRELYYTYSRWKAAERRLGANLLELDPFSMISQYDGKTALRPTGADGTYDPNGKVTRVRINGPSSFMSPYYLALIKLGERRCAIKARSSFGMVKASKNDVPPEYVEKLVAAITRYKDDWVSISKEVGLPKSKCRKSAERLADRLSSLRYIISNPEIERLIKEDSSKPHSDDATNIITDV